ncbi:MAG: hypothetical protein E7191_03270 [Erysipelotrichaceae bacterium]|nr:hypothetical protein [Erysipelotrichaceae bacterium]
MMFIELFEIGFFAGLFNWSNILLTLGIFLCILIPMGIHMFLLQKYPRISKYLVVLSIIGVIALEIVCQMTTGWDRFAWLIIYGFVVCIFLGIILAYPISKYRTKRRERV